MVVKGLVYKYREEKYYKSVFEEGERIVFNVERDRPKIVVNVFYERGYADGGGGDGDGYGNDGDDDNHNDHNNHHNHHNHHNDVFVNDVNCVYVEFTNVSHVEARDVNVAMDLPFIYFTDDDDDDDDGADGTACGNDTYDNWNDDEPVDNMLGCSGLLHHITDSLGAGCTVVKKAYVLAKRCGDNKMKGRCVWNGRHTSSFDVMFSAKESVRCDWNVEPSYENSREYVVAVDVVSDVNSTGYNGFGVPDVINVGGWSRNVLLDKSIDGFNVRDRGVSHFIVNTINDHCYNDDYDDGNNVKFSTVGTSKDYENGARRRNWRIIRNFIILEKTYFTMKTKIEEHKKKKIMQDEEGAGIVKSIQEIRRDANLAKSKRDGTFNGDSDADGNGGVREPKERVGTMASVSSRRDCGADMFLSYTYPGSTAVVSFVAAYVAVRPTADSVIGGCPLLVTADYDKSVPFGGGGDGAEHAVVVHLRNRFFGVGDAVDFIFEVGAIPGVEINGPQTFRSSLKPGEAMEVPLKAVYLQRGVFNLQNMRITVANGDRSVPYLFPFHWCVEVT
jgi:hypothetical protein